jgi:cytochrome c oxidase subunit 2
MRAFLAAGLIGLAAAGEGGMYSSQPEVRVVEISAERFAFTPSEVKVPAGTRIEFRLRSDDTDHGFRILGTGVNIRIPKRGKGAATVAFDATTPGRYTFECSKLCGAGHSFMRGVIIVTE